MPTLETTLAKIALRDERFISSMMHQGSAGAALDHRISMLAQLGALIGVDGATASYIASVQDALNAGVSPAEIVATLVAVMPSVGIVRASSAAPKIALALGLEPDQVLEDDDMAWHESRR